MKMNKKGFTLIELLAVIVILAVIALIAAPIILGIINDARESSNLRSVESYGKGIVTQTSSYQTVHPDVDKFEICVGSGAATTACHVDATVAARDSGTSSSTITDARVVTYSGTGIVCTSASYDETTAITSLTGCKVGSSSNSYKWDSKSGAVKE
jgi:prepilin-type N-terminal cleavage/methylation domain